MCHLIGSQTGGIVATDFVNSGTEWRSTVELTNNNVVGTSKATFKIRAYGCYENEKSIFCGRMHSNLGAGADKQRTNVESRTAFIGRNETFVEFNNLFNHIDEEVCRNFRHDDAARGTLQACCI